MITQQTRRLEKTKKKIKSFNNVCFLFSITHYRTETTTSWVNQRNICHLQLPTMSQQTTSLPTRQIYAITQTEQKTALAH